MSSFQEMSFGIFGGITGQIMCYPVDTWKTRLQLDPEFSLTKEAQKYGWRKTLYSGLPSPLISIMLEKACLFSFYKKFNDKFQSPFYSGLMAGVACTLIVTPFESIKIKSQFQKLSSYQTLRTTLAIAPLSLYRGWSTTLLREVPGYGIYFYTYEKARRHLGEAPEYFLRPWQSFLIGSMAGISAWIVIYPSDTVKTMSQNENIPVQKAFQTIVAKAGWQGLYRGYTWGLMRAGIVHGGVFLGYETSRKLWKQI